MIRTSIIKTYGLYNVSFWGLRGKSFMGAGKDPVQGLNFNRKEGFEI